MAPIPAKKNASVLTSHKHYNNTNSSDFDTDLTIKVTAAAANDSDDFATEITTQFKSRS